MLTVQCPVYGFDFKGQIQSPWLGDKVDSGIGMVTVLGVDSGVDIRGGYSQLRHRVTYTIFFFVFGLSSSHPILSLETAFVHILCKVDTLNPFLFKTNG